MVFRIWGRPDACELGTTALFLHMRFHHGDSVLGFSQGGAALEETAPHRSACSSHHHPALLSTPSPVTGDEEFPAFMRLTSFGRGGSTRGGSSCFFFPQSYQEIKWQLPPTCMSSLWTAFLPEELSKDSLITGVHFRRKMCTLELQSWLSVFRVNVHLLRSPPTQAGQCEHSHPFSGTGLVTVLAVIEVLTATSV